MTSGILAFLSPDQMLMLEVRTRLQTVERGLVQARRAGSLIGYEQMDLGLLCVSAHYEMSRAGVGNLKRKLDSPHMITD